FEMQNPTFTNGICSATYAVLKRTGGTVYSLGSFTAACATTSLIRMVVRPGILIVWPANANWAFVYGDNTITTGKAGVGGYGMPAGNSVTNVKIGPLDRV